MEEKEAKMLVSFTICITFWESIQQLGLKCFNISASHSCKSSDETESNILLSVEEERAWYG